MDKIFVVEDERKLCRELMAVLEINGYSCVSSENFEHMAKEILDAEPDLVLLDINLPGCDGFSICREVRQSSQVPILIVTSRDTNMDEVFGFHVGADDFITKPYNIHVLLARMERLLKRWGGQQKPDLRLTHKGVVLDILKSRIEYDGKQADLTKNELGIMRILMENKGNVIPRNEIIKALWEQDEFVEDSTLTVNINRIRKKLENMGVTDFLVTRRGHGYQV